MLKSSVLRISWSRCAVWLKDNQFSFFVFLVLWFQGATLGLSDDEAYYWVLAQRPSFGYAYHPPAVAWVIALCQTLFGWMFQVPIPLVVRLPAAFCSSCILVLVLQMFREMGLDRKLLNRAGLVLLSFFGFFSLAWMIVPDQPLLLGWTLLFVTTWRILFSKTKSIHFGILIFAAALTILSKYSGILAIGSAGLSVLIWGGTPKQKLKASLALGFGFLLGLIPILIWNSEHDWGSLLYQIRDRHGGQISWLRYLRFWIVEAVIAGPILVGYAGVLLKEATQAQESYLQTPDQTHDQIPDQIHDQTPDRQTSFRHAGSLQKYLALWILPAAAVFCVQPLFSDFKPHWAFVVWLPVAIGMAWRSCSSSWKWIRYQVAYGLALGGLVLICCHVPLGNALGKMISGAQFDPRLDVTNDLYGWNELGAYFRENLSREDQKLPVVGSRYQTASQAAFNLSGIAQVTLLPRDLKERDEWPDLQVSEHSGPGWPSLKQSILFVTDNRYSAAPEFLQAHCKSIYQFNKNRLGMLSKRIEFWRCDP